MIRGFGGNKKQKNFMKDMFDHHNQPHHEMQDLSHDEGPRVYRSATVINGKKDKHYKDLA